MIFDTGNACCNLMRTRSRWTYTNYIRLSNLECENRKLIKPGTEGTGKTLRTGDRISGDKTHNERVHTGAMLCCLSKTEMVTHRSFIENSGVKMNRVDLKRLIFKETGD